MEVPSPSKTAASSRVRLPVESPPTGLAPKDGRPGSFKHQTLTSRRGHRRPWWHARWERDRDIAAARTQGRYKISTTCRGRRIIVGGPDHPSITKVPHQRAEMDNAGQCRETRRPIAGGSASFAEAGPNTRDFFRRTHGALVPSMVR